jgi:hypothetical protein
MGSCIDGAHLARAMRGEVSTGSPARAQLSRRALIGGAAGVLAGATLLPRIASAVEPGASWFDAVDPQRLCDTRPRPGFPVGFGYQRLNSQTIRVSVTGNGRVPADAVAAVLTVTGVGGGATTFLTTYPAGAARPDTSSLNMSPLESAVANLVTVKLGGGAVDVFMSVPRDVIVDLVGVYRPTSTPVSAGRLVTLPSAARAIDTRRSGVKPGPGAVVPVNLNGLLPLGATAVVGNLTAVDASGHGFFTAFPRGTALPATSNLNVGAGQTRAVGVIAKVAFSGGVTGIDLFTSAGAHLLFDVVGYMTGPADPAGPSAAGLFVPITPTRVYDSRRERLRSWNGWTRQFGLPSPINTRAQAVALNLTVTSTLGSGGYLTLHPAQVPRREVSNLNFDGPGRTVANHAISRISERGLACYSFQPGHVIADVTGWYTGRPQPIVTGTPVNPPPPGGPLAWALHVPRMGVQRWVFDGHPDRTVNAGHVWHWAGTGLVGQGAAAVLFGHRTEYGGPFRNQHWLRAGDLAYVTTSDGRRYTYRMVTDQITSKHPSDILAASRRLGGESIALVSCSKTNKQPTSLEYRLVSLFSFVGWEDLG